MLYHCGLLDERPDRSRTLNWIKRGDWEAGLPADVEKELYVWLAMPGLSINFHAHNFKLSRQYLRRFVGGFEEHRAEVAENWLSATREDCVKLSQLRPPKGDLPLLVQLSILNDLKAGRRVCDLMKEYQINRRSFQSLRKGHVRVRQPLPRGFELLVSGHHHTG